MWLAPGCTAGAATGGIHARMAYSEEQGLRVIEVPPRGSASRAGLLPKDLIITIDDKPVREMAASKVIERLRGPVGSTVALEVVRDGEIKAFVVVREPYGRH